MTFSQNILTFFSNGGTPSIGLTPVIKVIDLADNSVVVNDESMTENGSGFYSYAFATYDPEKDYAIRCDGGSGLSATDRYTFAGNENYVNDIWDTSISSHQVVGSMASEIRASHGTAIGSGSGHQGISKQEAEAIAKMVWQVVLNNEMTAEDTLVSRSAVDDLKRLVNYDDTNIVANLEMIKQSIALIPTDNEAKIDLGDVISSITELKSTIVNRKPDTKTIKEIHNTVVDLTELKDMLASIEQMLYNNSNIGPNTGQLLTAIEQLGSEQKTILQEVLKTLYKKIVFTKYDILMSNNRL